MFCRIFFSGFLFKDPKYQQGCVEAKIKAPEPGKSSIKNDSTLPEAEIQTDSTLPEAKPDEEFDSCIIKIY